MNLINKIAKTSFLAIIALLCSLIMILLGTTTAYAESKIEGDLGIGTQTEQSVTGATTHDAAKSLWQSYFTSANLICSGTARSFGGIGTNFGEDWLNTAESQGGGWEGNVYATHFTSGELSKMKLIWATRYIDNALVHAAIDSPQKAGGYTEGINTDNTSFYNQLRQGYWGKQGSICTFWDTEHPNSDNYTYYAYWGPTLPNGSKSIIVLCYPPCAAPVNNDGDWFYETGMQSTVSLFAFGGWQYEMSTQASDSLDGNKKVLARTDSNISDVLTISNFDSNTTYTYACAVYAGTDDSTSLARSEGEITTDANGHAEFTVDKWTWAENQDLSNIAAGTVLNIRSAIFIGSTTLVHNSSLTDTNEQLTVVEPSITTTLKDDDGLIAKSFGQEHDSFTDEVKLTGLEEGQTYRIDGQLYDKTTGKMTSYTATSSNFKAEETSPTVKVQFTDVNTIDLKGHSLVCYETLTKIDGTTETVIAKHEEPTDTAQTIYIPEPEISTKARINNNGKDSQEIIADPESVITDAITLENIQPNIDYIITSELVTSADDNKVLRTETTSYTPKAADGATDNIKVTFENINTSALKTTDVLAVRTTIKTANGTLVAEHNKNLKNTEQKLIVIRPAISTTAVDGIDKDKIIIKDPEAIIIDTVEYSNLIIGKPYTLNGKLYDKATGEPFLDANGAEVVGSATFTPKKESDSQDVTFSFDITNMEIDADDLSLVVFEDLYRGTTLMVSHEDINDVDQTVAAHEPSIETTATDLVDSDKSVVRDPKSVIVDKVLYEGLVPGKTYTITGTLMDKSTGDELLINGKPVTKAIMFAPDSVNGFVTLRFEFDSSALEDNSVIVVFESLYRDDKLITVHNDIDDEEQSVTIIPPEIHTLATDTTDNDNIISGDIDTIINDKVMMTNLVPSFEYAYDGYQVRDNGVVMIYNEIPTTYIAEYYITDDDDEETSYEKYQTLLKYTNIPHGFYVLNSTNNTYDTCSKEGTIDTSPTQIPAELFEATLKYEDAVIAGVYGYHVSVDYDADTKEITVNNDVDVYTADTLPMTVSAGKYSWDEETSAWIQAADSIVGGGSATYDDEIMQQVISEHGERTTQYSLKGSLVSKEDGKTIVAGDKEVVGSVSFTVDTAGVVTLNEGTEVPTEVVNVTEELLNAYSVVDVVFEFDSTGVGDDVSLVAFEELYSGDETVAEHKDLSDEDETVVVKQPSIGTKAVSVGGLNSKLIDAPNTSVQVVDTVSYENLVVGRTYSVSGVLMDKDTGSALLDDKGKEVIASATFTADATSGSVDVPFSFSYDLRPGVKAGVVAFETLYRCDDDGKVTDTIVAEHKDWNDADQFLGWNDVAEELVAAGDNVSLLGLMGFLVVSGVLIISRRRHCL